MADRAQVESGNLGPQPVTPLPQTFYRPRFLVLPTGRTVFAWGVWDTDKAPLGSIAQLTPRTEDWVSRHRNMSLAILKARALNKLYSQSERKAAA